MKQFVIALIKICVSILVLWFLTYTSKLNFSLLLALFNSPGLLLLTVLLYFIVIATSSWRWMRLNKAQNIQLTYIQTILPTYLGVAFNNLLPGGVGGDFFRFYFLNKKTPTKKSVVMLSILFDRITGLTGIFIAVGLVSILELPNFSNHKLTFYFTLLCLMICFGLVTIYFISSFLLPQTGLSNWLNTRFHKQKWLSPVLSILEGLRIYRNEKKAIIECLAASLIIQLLIALTCMLIAQMMHFPSLSINDYIMAIAITQLVNLIPIAPGGFGVGEIAFANVLLLLNPGTSGTYATIFLAYRIIGIVTYLPGIFVLIFDKKLLKQQNNFEHEVST